MKKIYLILFGAMLYCLTARAQTTDKNQTEKATPTLGIGVEGVIPVSDNSYTFGIGGSLKAAFPVGNTGDITLTGGYTSLQFKKSANITGTGGLVPLKAGYRFRFTNGNFYVEPQAGITLATGVLSGNNFTYAANAGFLTNGGFDIAVRFESLVSKEGNLSLIGLRIGYNFEL